IARRCRLSRRGRRHQHREGHHGVAHGPSSYVFRTITAAMNTASGIAADTASTPNPFHDEIRNASATQQLATNTTHASKRICTVPTSTATPHPPFSMNSERKCTLFVAWGGKRER